MLWMTIFGFLGGNLMWLMGKYVKSINIMLLLLVVSTFIGLVWTFLNLNHELSFYIKSLYISAFLYGCFLRATPMLLFQINDFDQRNQLTNRYISYMLAYTIWGSLAICILDWGHLYRHTPNDDYPSALCTISSLISLVATLGYWKIYVTKK